MATTKIIPNVLELNPGDPENVLKATNAVTVSNASGANKYYFDGVYLGKFGLRLGTTVLTGIPVDHPFTIMNNGKTSQITISGSDTVSGTAPGGDSYTFYYNTATITVLADFGTISYACSAHGYMGGENNFVSVYSDAGLKMPTGTAFSGTPDLGMMRNDTTQSTASSSSTMQHYNGSEWKNYVNINPDYNIEYLIIGGGGAGGGGNSTYDGGGGGGAGGFLTGTVTQSAGVTINITVGAGGVGIINRGNNGGDSIVINLGGSTKTATGGGGGAAQVFFAGAGADGGSGGGGGPTAGATGGGTATPAGQGNDGGIGSGTVSGGGGGAGAAGGNAGGNTAGSGGNGLDSQIVTTGVNVTYAGGGGGSGYTGFTPGSGGSGGGGGGASSPGAGAQGTDGLGGGGGGGCFASGAHPGGDGGDGVVILRMLTANEGTYSNATKTTDGSYTVLTFATGSGSYNS